MLGNYVHSRNSSDFTAEMAPFQKMYHVCSLFFVYHQVVDSFYLTLIGLSLPKVISQASERSIIFTQSRGHLELH